MSTFYEDVTVGETTAHGSYEVTREEMLRFARQYDPQWFHTDPERAAEESPYGGLIASGWHTAAITMRLIVEGVISDAEIIGATGIDELRFRAPVRPGDSLRIETEMIEKVPERPDWGLVRGRTRTFNEEEEVFSMIGNMMYRRRDDAEE